MISPSTRRERTAATDALTPLVADGTLTAAQADRVSAVLAGADAGTDRPPSSRWSVTAEVAVYAGAALTGVAGSTLLAQLWDGLPVAAGVGVLAVTALLLTAAGRWLRDPADRVRDRMCGVAWLFAAATAAAAGGVAVHEAATLPGRPDTQVAATAAGVALAGLALAVPLYRTRRSGLQQLAVVGSGLWLVGLLELTDATAFVAALIPTVAGLAWLAAGLAAWLAPRRAVVTTGAVVALAAAQALTFTGVTGWADAGIAVALTIAAGLLVVGVAASAAAVGAIGGVGLLVLGAQAVADWFGNTGGTLVGLAVAGLLLVGAGLASARRHARSSRARSIERP